MLRHGAKQSLRRMDKGIQWSSNALAPFSSLCVPMMASKPNTFVSRNNNPSSLSVASAAYAVLPSMRVNAFDRSVSRRLFSENAEDPMKAYFERRVAAQKMENERRQQEQPAETQSNGGDASSANINPNNNRNYPHERPDNRNRDPSYVNGGGRGGGRGRGRGAGRGRGPHNQYKSNRPYNNNNNGNAGYRQDGNNSNDMRSNNNTRFSNNNTPSQSNQRPQGPGRGNGQDVNRQNYRDNNQSGNRFQHSPRRQQQHQHRRPHQQQRPRPQSMADPQKTARIADLMRNLKRETPLPASSDRAPVVRNQRRQSPPSWGQQRGRPSFLQQKRPQEGYGQSQFGQMRERRRPAQRPKVESDGFLAGRVARSDDAKAVPLSQQEQQTIMIPAYGMTLVEISNLLRVKQNVIKKNLYSLGERVPRDDAILEPDLVELLALELGLEIERVEASKTLEGDELLMHRRVVAEEIEDVAEETEDEALPATVPTRLVSRPPVVCIMGHVDHGKTTLMDALRRRSQDQQQPTKKTKKKKGAAKDATKAGNVAGTEAGGITQVVSAFQVAMGEDFGEDKVVTFLDTPGHAAFKSMRQSGSHAADVIVLVVAADDGVSEQTVEIINFYKSIVQGSGDSGISMVVALNKIDKPGIDVDNARLMIENQLMEHGIYSEGMNGASSEYGAPVQIVPTSGLTGLGLDDLMEGLVLQSEVMDLKADADALAEGIVMDAKIEKGLGVVADCIIRWGSLTKGDVVVSGTQYGRVRVLKDANDKMLKVGTPSMPVRIVGFKSLPKAGDPLICVESDEKAEELIERRTALAAAESGSDSDRPDLPKNLEVHVYGMRSRDTFRVGRYMEKADLDLSDGRIRVPIIVKAEADGSLSAVRESLVDLGNSSIHRLVVDPVHEGVGAITESDIQMAKESNAAIFAFGLKRIDQATINLAETEGVQLYANDVIYSLLDQAKETYSAYLPPVPTTVVHGKAEVKAVFVIDGKGGKESIAGLQVLDGSLYHGAVPKSDTTCHFRVLRDGKQISPKGELVTASSLRHFKELVDSVRRGEECGLGLSGFEDFEAGDAIECYSVEMKSPLFE